MNTMRTNGYLVLSLNSKTNVWQEVYEAGSLKEARRLGVQYLDEAEKRRAGGRVHYCVGVKVIRPGICEDPLFVRYSPGAQESKLAFGGKS